MNTPKVSVARNTAPAVTPFTEDLRGFVDRLRGAGELVDLHQPVDIRHIATLVDQSDKALMFHNVIGYKMPVLSGIVRSAQRAFMSMNCNSYREVEAVMTHGLANPIAPVRVETSATEEVIFTGDQVDLFSLPVPIFCSQKIPPRIRIAAVGMKYFRNSGPSGPWRRSLASLTPSKAETTEIAGVMTPSP